LYEALHMSGVMQEKPYFHRRVSSERYGKPSRWAASLPPDYTISWKSLFEQPVGVLLANGASVEARDDRKAAVVKSKGVILSKVSPVESNRVHTIGSGRLSLLSITPRPCSIRGNGEPNGFFGAR